ncbi:MAG: thiamine-phosphate kinase [Saprospiraceae bacterium]|jgi:thiamine-monophosphate kinase|nr:thiamine-phosphate kinase [Saprospiraceae bacterium]MBK6480145.1 thiamine-phosphate kinase [Saprospiraceae bacterium]MBK6814999.1 thiamine-phosphate kinase [Saprospiraceae bacterium]MBK7372046.1 thiamine-phosphate kinase [Saprospiraceae bacterium]MBK7435500.1 thiamine-phosphate kinase [Saprospiraceae bacterium]
MTEKRTDVNTLGEFGLIDHLTKDTIQYNPETVKAVGDDAAVIALTKPLCLVSTDTLVEGIHFDLGYTPLKHLGYKSVIVNLSDIYAMNGIPTQVTFSMALSNRFSVEALEELYEGIHLACKHYQVDLVGGDTTSSPKGLFISVTAIGQATEDEVVYRSGAQIGDLICITGELGAAYLGLQLLEREKQIFDSTPGIQPELNEKYSYLLSKQLKPEARKDVIETFHRLNIRPHAMIDISDGLSSEIMHICKQSGCGALIEEKLIPIVPIATELALEFNINPITAALNGGEDYELLFTISEKEFEKIKYLPGFYVIGEIRPAKENTLLQTTGGRFVPLEAQGWKHM